MERLAKELKTGDVVEYCGCEYHITYLEKPDQYGTIFMSSIKTHKGNVVSNSFHLVRHENDLVKVNYGILAIMER